MPSLTNRCRLAHGPIIAASAALAIALSGSAGAGAGERAAATPSARDGARAARRTPVVEVFEQARGAVVNVSTTEIVTVRGRSTFDGFFDDLFDMPSPRRQLKREAVGSGFVIHPDGYIVTNAHVVARTTEQRAIFADGREYDAQIVAADPARDLAVLKVEAEGPLPTLHLGRSDDLMVGETVIAIGNPLGYQHTVTAGVVSAIDRSIQVAPELSFDGLIQTDASINPGNSGGPLLNVLGELIGVNTAIRGDAQNIGFAIPVDRLREILPALLDVERRYRLEAGLRVDSLEEPRVASVRPGSPADEAGLRPGDVLRMIDGRPVREGIDFDIALIDRRAGDVLELAVDRGGEPVRTALRLAARPAPDGLTLARTRLGLAVRDIGGDAQRAMLEVESIEPNGPAWSAGIEEGDFLVALGRYHVRSADELGQLLEPLEERAVVPITIIRMEGQRKTQRSGPIQVR
jgi:serine protease Do